MRRISGSSPSSSPSPPSPPSSSSSPQLQVQTSPPFRQPATSSSSRKRTPQSGLQLLLPRLQHALHRHDSGGAPSTPLLSPPPGPRSSSTRTFAASSPANRRGGGGHIRGVPILYLVLLLLVYALSMAALQTKVVTWEVVRSVQMYDDNPTTFHTGGGGFSGGFGVNLPHFHPISWGAPASSPQGIAARTPTTNGSSTFLHAYLVPTASSTSSDRRGSRRPDSHQSSSFFGGGVVEVPRAGMDPHYGGLHIRSLFFDSSRPNDVPRARTASPRARTIHPNDAARHHEEKKKQLRAMAKTESYYEDYYDHYDDIDWETRKDGCIRPRTTYEFHPTCNAFHERPLGIADPNHPSAFLGRGYYRMSWTLGDANRNVSQVALKQLRLRDGQDLDNEAYEQVRVEAMSMERTSGSDRTTDIYGHCSTSIMVEMAYPIEYKLIPAYSYPEDPSTIVGPQNHLTAPQKLAVSLAMAEGLALLHGNYDGAIVNDDIQMSQWLLGKDNKIKLNDFNKAVILEWSPVNHTYCDMHSMYTHQYRAPEQLNYHWPVDERADVFAFGHTMYSILTGMVPFYEHGSRETSIQFNKEGGALPYLDPTFYRNRTRLIEYRLAEIMEPCYQYRREDRTSIFRVVRHLRETVRMYEKKFPNEPRIADVSLRDIVEDGFG